MGDVRLGREHRPGAVGPIEIIVPRRFPLADSKRGQCFVVGILRRRMLLDLGIDRLPGVDFGVGGLVAQPVKTGDVIRTRRFAGFGNARVVALGGCERMKVAARPRLSRRRRPAAQRPLTQEAPQTPPGSADLHYLMRSTFSEAAERMMASVTATPWII